ncbi:hypothetical protein [Vibrio panuliri]|uniref:Glycosyl hydrolase family 32 N-terminal domain-containing protein n=1 Tax=Vibrio panuliri TaxID=1381081 RepID=A0ABX3FQT7_9VIBR|nr:hypothetical protein [Vibrio panuliri]KAB1454645.1 hypothetical protein F7O85_17425 [Vibrio panuliri]OLQ96606.1 hypothetical protein BIY20_18490 [Vibrio panuliri]
MHLLSAIGSFIKPLSLKFSEGKFHLFYLFTLTNREEEKSVGHATSTNLVNWEHQSVVVLDANGYEPIGIHIDHLSESQQFPQLSSNNFVIFYRDLNGGLHCRYWDKYKDIWHQASPEMFASQTNVDTSTISIANDPDSGFIARLNKDNGLNLSIFHQNSSDAYQTKIDDINAEEVRSARLDIGLSLIDNQKLVILITLYIKDSNEKKYLKYEVENGSLIEISRAEETGTKNRMLSLTSGRVLEFSITENAKGIMVLPTTVSFMQNKISRGNPIEILNEFNTFRKISPGPFCPIAATYNILINATQLQLGESLMLALYSNEAPLLRVLKRQDEQLDVTFGYKETQHHQVIASQNIDIIVDHNIVELRSEDAPPLLIELPDQNSRTAGILICPSHVEVNLVLANS